MKKLIIVLICAAVISPLFAQDDSRYNSSDIYYTNVSVEKVYPTGQGYIIQYRRGVNQIGTVGIPNEWFTDAASKAELINLPWGNSWPTLSVFYKNGEFSHVRLYVHRAKGHITWGSISQSTDVSRYFVDSDSFKLEL